MLLRPDRLPFVIAVEVPHAFLAPPQQVLAELAGFRFHRFERDVGRVAPLDVEVRRTLGMHAMQRAHGRRPDQHLVLPRAGQSDAREIFLQDRLKRVRMDRGIDEQMDVAAQLERAQQAHEFIELMRREVRRNATYVIPVLRHRFLPGRAFSCGISRRARTSGQSTNNKKASPRGTSPDPGWCMNVLARPDIRRAWARLILHRNMAGSQRRWPRIPGARAARRWRARFRSRLCAILRRAACLTPCSTSSTAARPMKSP